MKQFIINVPDDKGSFFEELMRSLDFVISENKIVSEPVPEWHKDIVRNRINSASEDDYIPWYEAKQMIKRNKR